MKKINIVGIGGSGMSYHRHDAVAGIVKSASKTKKSYKKVEQMCKFTEKSDIAFFRGFKHHLK